VSVTVTVTVGVADWVWSTHATVSVSLLPAVEVRVFTLAHVSMITYRVDVYRSRPIGASIPAGWAWSTHP